MKEKERMERQQAFENLPKVDLERMDFGARIKQLRQEMGMTQVELAEKLGYHRGEAYTAYLLTEEKGLQAE